MGGMLAEAADRNRGGDGVVEALAVRRCGDALPEVVESITTFAKGMRAAVLFLAQQMEDPEGADIGEAMLDALRGIVVTEAAD
jgi:hypothetical protein